MKIYDELREKYNAGIAHTFLFYGATFDYVENHTFLKNFLIKRFTEMGKVRKNIIVYDRADGIDFPTQTDREAFMQAVGADIQDFGGALPKDPAGAFDLIGRALKKDHFALIINYAETVFPNGDMATMPEADRTAIVSALKWARDSKEIMDLGNIIIMITTALSQIHTSLREPASRIEAIGIPYPGPAEREKFIKETIEIYKKKKSPIQFENDFDPDFMSRATAGLARVHMIDIIQRAQSRQEPISLSMVKERKNDIIKAEFQDTLQIVEPEFGFELIGGYDYIKEYLRKNVIEAIRTGNKRRVPQGVLLMGPAGTGKTAIAQALAFECGINYVSLNIGRLFNRWVGSSEENIEKALWAIKSVRPVIVFIDELDTAISRGNGGDSGVSNRIMKSLLEFMSDTSHRGEIIFLAATNKPEDIDFALKRTGRFDRKIPVLPPTGDEIPAIWMTMLKKHAITHAISPEDIAGLDISETMWGKTGMVGSDIEALVLKAYEIAEDNGRNEVTMDDIQEAVACLRPSTQDTASMIASAIKECNDISLLPEHYRKSATQKAVPTGRGL